MMKSFTHDHDTKSGWVGWLLVFILLAADFASLAQPIAFNHLSVDNGLSQNSVLCTVQDHRGFMWFGTRYGLNRYDSRTFKVYKHDPSKKNSLVDNYILSLCVDAENTLWVGTVKGLSKYHPETDSFEEVPQQSKGKPGLSNSVINCIFQDRRKNIWIGTDNGLNLLTNQTTNQFRVFLHSETVPGIAGDNVRTVFEDYAGTLWVGTTKGLTRIQRSKTGFQWLSFAHNPKQANSLTMSSPV